MTHDELCACSVHVTCFASFAGTNDCTAVAVQPASLHCLRTRYIFRCSSGKRVCNIYCNECCARRLKPEACACLVCRQGITIIAAAVRCAPFVVVNACVACRREGPLLQQGVLHRIAAEQVRRKLPLLQQRLKAPVAAKKIAPKARHHSTCEEKQIKQIN